MDRCSRTSTIKVNMDKWALEEVTVELLTWILTWDSINNNHMEVAISVEAMVVVAATEVTPTIEITKKVALIRSIKHSSADISRSKGLALSDKTVPLLTEIKNSEVFLT